MEHHLTTEGQEAMEEFAGAHILLNVLLVGLGGMLGALARYGVEAGVTKVVGVPFPVGTFVINVTGAFALGVLTVLVVEKDLLHALFRPAFGIGFLGAYTTFSTFAIEALALAEGAMLVQALAYVVATNVVGILSAWGGVVFARSM